MSKGQEISIKVDGVEARGSIFHRSEADIGIRILWPYQGFSTGLHIPYFSRPYHSFLTEYGVRTAENLLKYLFELSLYMKTNRIFIELQFTLHFHEDDYLSSESQERFFGSTFPFAVPIGTREDVLNILRSK